MSRASSVMLFVLFSQPHCLEHIPNFQHPRRAHSLFSRLIEIVEEDTISNHAESDSDSEAVSGSGRSGNERKSRLCSNPIAFLCFFVSRRNRITRQVGNHSVKGAKRRIRPQRHFLEHLLKQTIRLTGMIDNLSDVEEVRLLRAAKKFGSGIRTGCRQFLSRSSTLDFNTLPRDALPKTLRSDHRVPRPSKPGMCRSGTTVDMDTLGRSEGLVYQSVEFHLT